MAKILFIPRNIGMWRKDFRFNSPDHCEFIAFDSVEEFHSWLQQRGVRMNDADYPFTVSTVKELHNRVFGSLKSVIQFTLIGWVLNY